MSLFLFHSFMNPKKTSFPFPLLYHCNHNHLCPFSFLKSYKCTLVTHMYLCYYLFPILYDFPKFSQFPKPSFAYYFLFSIIFSILLLFFCVLSLSRMIFFSYNSFINPFFINPSGAQKLLRGVI